MKTNRFWLSAWTACTVSGVVAGVIALQNLFRYSPYQDPGDLGRGLILAVLAVVLIAAIPVVAFLSFVIRAEAAYSAWKRSLPPEELLAVRAAETAGMIGAHLWMRERNRRADAELTASVMGGEGGSRNAW